MQLGNGLINVNDRFLNQFTQFYNSFKILQKKITILGIFFKNLQPFTQNVGYFFKIMKKCPNMGSEDFFITN